jgi:hypothetical protein
LADICSLHQSRMTTVSLERVDYALQDVRRWALERLGGRT